ncbi:MAG: hypothetical protein DYH13_10765 [Alphaproteobacteria bacterium PRO2]|nr:hypothetical protein [Alphaproteobacteria bacterium PRO2]
MKSYWKFKLGDMELPLQMEHYKMLRALGYRAIFASYIFPFATFFALALKFDGDVEQIWNFIDRLGIWPLILIAAAVIISTGVVNVASYQSNKLYLEKQNQKRKARKRRKIK